MHLICQKQVDLHRCNELILFVKLKLFFSASKIFPQLIILYQNDKLVLFARVKKNGTVLSRTRGGKPSSLITPRAINYRPKGPSFAKDK